MGSEIVEALVVQIGKIKTNPNNLVPEVSRPIEQIAIPFTKDFKPIEQILPPEIGFPTSQPVEQVGILQFAGGLIPTTPPNNSIIEQVILASEPQKSGGAVSYEGPVEQFKLSTDNDVLQQFILSNSPNNSKPVEQVPNPTNDIDITQFDFIDLIFPPCNTTKNPVDTNILWRIKDFGFAFDVGTLVFKVNGIEVQDRDSFSVTGIVGGLQLDYDPPEDFGFSEEVEVFLEIQDTAVPPNTFFYRCKWTTVPDTKPPVITNVEPECNSTDVSVVAPVEFDVLDVGEGVDPNSIQLTIEGVVVCSGVTLEATSVPGFGTGYHVTYEHPDDPFRFDASVTIGIEATDLSPARNSAFFVCFFNTEESEVPIFMNFYPEPCDSFIDNVTGLTFEVYGVEDGIDISTLEVHIDQKLRKVFVRPRILRSQ
jgi:hypothetical protein